MRSRMTYLRSPFPNTRPRPGPNPCPRHGPLPKNPFIAFGPNINVASFVRVALNATPCLRRQLSPIMLPEGVPESPLAGAHLYVPVLCQSGEHSVRLGYAEARLERRPGGRELPVPRERCEELLLPTSVVYRPPRPRLEEARHAPRVEPERRHQEDGDHPEAKEERKEVERPGH